MGQEQIKRIQSSEDTSTLLVAEIRNLISKSLKYFNLKENAWSLIERRLLNTIKLTVDSHTLDIYMMGRLDTDIEKVIYLIGKKIKKQTYPEKTVNGEIIDFYKDLIFYTMVDEMKKQGNILAPETSPEIETLVRIIMERTCTQHD